MDVNIIKGAPERQLLAGIGDTVSKYTALYDWKLAGRKTGENVDDLACMLSYMAFDSIHHCERGELKNPDFIHMLTNALLDIKAQSFMTYDYHQMAGHYNGEGLMRTTEAFAADATQYVVETFTMHGAVGLYRNAPGKTKGSVGYYNATEDVPQSAMQRLKIWFKVANQGKLSEASEKN